MRRTFATFLFLLSATSVLAQGYRGRDFWVCFPKNAVIEGNRPLQLSLFITAETRATGVIVNTVDTSRIEFSVEAGASTEIDLDTEIEIQSSAKIEQKSLHLTSDHDITLYVVSHRPSSTDSYAAIPTNLLGTEYMEAGYLMLRNGPESFTSQAAAIATEDNTLVTIHLTDSTRDDIGGRFPKGRTVVFPMNRGQTIQVQGAYNGAGNDLTGTTFSSTKPIAFFAGGTCAQMPPGEHFCNMLLEMEPPESDWGHEFVLAKFEGKDYYVVRVIAGADSTEVSLNGKPAATLARGSYYEIDTLRNNAVVTTSKPALVAQYGTSSTADQVKVGDPFMLFAVPTDRFISEVATTSVVGGAFRYYLNIVLPKEAVPSLRLDGFLIEANQSSHLAPPMHEEIVPGGKYAVVTLRVPEGRHLVECGEPMAVYSYGFGEQDDNYDSYAHACGMRLGK